MGMKRGWTQRRLVIGTAVIALVLAAVLLIGGRNAWFGIETIRVDVEREAYVVTVPERDRYLVAVPVAAPEGQTHVLPEDIRFYDAHGADLTEQIWNR